MKFHILLVVFMWFVFVANDISAQELSNDSVPRASVIGYTTDSLNLITLAFVDITNLTSGKHTASDDSGMFKIEVRPNDVLLFSEIGYHNLRYTYKGAKYELDTLQIWMKPKVQETLPGVVVSSYTYEDYQNDSSARREEFVQDVGLKKHTFESGNSGAGVGLSLDKLFSKKERAKKQAYELFNKLENEKYVDFRFNPTVVHSITGLKGNDLLDFMRSYRPSYSWLRENITYDDLKYYLLKRLKFFYLNRK